MPPGSPLAGHSVLEGRIRPRTGLTVIALMHRDGSTEDAGPETVLAAGDTLSGFLDDFPDVNRAQALAALQIARDSLSAAHHSEHTRDVPRLSETIDELSESGSVSSAAMRLATLTPPDHSSTE